MEKHCRAGQATAENMSHAHCVLDNYGYKRTLIMCSISCLSTTTIVILKCLNITLYVHCPSYYRQIQNILIKRLYHSLSTTSWLVFSKGVKVKVRPVRGSKIYSLEIFLLEAETPIAHQASRASYAASRAELICKRILINEEARWDAILKKKLSM